jgi:cysteine desulfurase family protein (TIGR01976 family)
MITRGPSLSISQIRQQFPALTRLQGQNPVAYFDGPGGTQVPDAVVQAMNDYLLHHNANTRWMFPTSVETDRIIAEAREAMADFLNAAPNEIVFGANMTTLTFHLARALGRDWRAGDEIIVTELDHHANVAPWRALEKERGLTIRMVRMNPENGQLDWQDFSEQLNDRTKLVAIGAASNALGTITDVRRAADLARRNGIRVFVDAVHFAPHQLIDVCALDCDFLACSAYKFYGPHIGILYARHELLCALDFPKLEPAPNEAPERAETGTQNHEGIAGAAAAINFLASLAENGTRRERLGKAFAGLEERTQHFVRRLWSGLGEIDGVKTYGPSPEEPRTPTIAFTVENIPASRVAARLAEEGIFVSDGDFYAATVVERLGLSQQGGLVRAGCACYTTDEEVERLIDAVRSVARR